MIVAQRLESQPAKIKDLTGHDMYGAASFTHISIFFLPSTEAASKKKSILGIEYPNGKFSSHTPAHPQQTQPHPAY